MSPGGGRGLCGCVWVFVRARTHTSAHSSHHATLRRAAIHRISRQPRHNIEEERCSIRCQHRTMEPWALGVVVGDVGEEGDDLRVVSKGEYGYGNAEDEGFGGVEEGGGGGGGGGCRLGCEQAYDDKHAESGYG